uniref:Uncharacterized protein n=1 Tax=Arundo donax TaxID=35708 RepID=A0A0A9GSW7_ARUDO
MTQYHLFQVSISVGMLQNTQAKRFEFYVE